ncbi:MAG TPA: cellulose synthase, partial [Pseudorhizobium sp.]|nr:cellulose synthase [Pseudorhizobium sp.]
MSVKLSILMVSAAVSAGLFVTQSNTPPLSLVWSPVADADAAGIEHAETKSADHRSKTTGFDSMAREIQALRQLPSRGERVRPKAPIVPFQLSQVDSDNSTSTTEAVEAEPQEQRSEVDETALRYFAAQGDTERLAAELARLRQLYPDWTPPADPLAIPQNADPELDAMWQLYAEGRHAEVRKAIVERRAEEAGWEPPRDLIERLEIAEARSRLVNASELAQYQTVIDVGAANPQLLNCSEVDVLWRIAEAFAATERPQRAVDAYSYILTNCTDAAERLATMQKAAAALPYARVQPLFAFEREDPGGGSEFDSIRDDLARRFVAQANDEPTLELAPQYLELVESRATTERSASDALLLGWYHLRRDNADEAATWFRRSRDLEDSANSSQGLALALLEQGKPAEAEDVLYPWRDASEDATATYLAATANLLASDPAPVIEDDVLSRMASAVIAEHYAPSAQQFGWYARAFEQPQTAAQWFETALEWSAEDEASAYGLALTRLQLNDGTGFSDIQKQWASKSPRIADLAVAPANAASENRTSRSVPPARQASPPQRAAALLPQTARPLRVEANAVSGTARARPCSGPVNLSRLPPAAALARGWCLMDLNRPLEAAESFQVAVGSSNPR